MTTQAPIETIRKTVTVALPAAQAFIVFTEEISTWWPLDSHSYGGEQAVRAVFEGRVGGRLYEVQADGTEADWATVAEWDPPHGFVLDWHICPSEVEVRFTDRDGSTRVELEHRGWERSGDRAADLRESYDGGWSQVLGRLAASAVLSVEGDSSVTPTRPSRPSPIGARSPASAPTRVEIGESDLPA